MRDWQVDGEPHGPQYVTGRVRNNSLTFSHAPCVPLCAVQHPTVTQATCALQQTSLASGPVSGTVTFTQLSSIPSGALPVLARACVHVCVHVCVCACVCEHALPGPPLQV